MPASDRQGKCEDKNGSRPCRFNAEWVVRVGSRESDRQLSCARHLSRTCWAMTEAEAPRTVYLTVTPLGAWQAALAHRVLS